MSEFYEMNTTEHRPWKKALCIFLSVVLAFGALVELVVGTSRIQDKLGIKSMLSAYAEEFVDTKGTVAVNKEAMLENNSLIDLENRDGSNTAYLFSEPITFIDDNGNLKAKDISVERQSDAELKNKGYTYTNGQNDYRINFAKNSDKGILVNFDGGSYSIIPQGKYDVEGSKSISETLNKRFEVFEYNNIYGLGTNLKFYPQLNGVKDEIVLDKNIGQNAFSFELKTENCTAQLNDDGTVTLLNKDGKAVQTFSAPFAYDSEYVEGDMNEHYIDCTYSLEEKENNTYILTVTVDKNWLENENTIYPVIIDPTTSNLTNYRDAGIYNKSTSASICYGKDATCCFGRASEYGYGRVLNMFTVPTAIKKGAKINSAYMWQRETTGRTTTTYVTPYIVNEYWEEGTVTWNKRPGYDTSSGMTKKNINAKCKDDPDNPNWYKFNIANAVKKWVDGTKKNYGVIFVSSEETDKKYNWRAFTSKQYSSSAMRPYTVINYTNDATAPTVTSVTGNATAWTKNNVTLTVNGAKDNSGGVGLHSTPYSFSTTKGSYSWQASNKKTFDKNQTVYVYVRDAYGNIRLVATIAINKIDKTAPTYTSVTGNVTSWTKNNVTLKVNGAADSQSGLNATAYSFSTTAGTYSWQSGNTKTVSSNGTYYIYIRDAVGNIKQATTQTVNKIDKTVPSAPNVTANATSWTNSNVTLTASSTDSQSGIAGYSFDGGATWQTENTKSFDTNQSVDVYAKDNAGNISSVSTYNITNIDKGAPSVSGVSGNPSVWTNEDVKLIVDGSVDTEAGLHSAPYSFDNGTTWQADNFKVFSSNQTVNIKVRDALGNEKVLDTVVISKIDKKAPTLEVITTSDAENITITAAAADSDSGISLYSFDSGISWQESNTFVAPKGTLNSIVVQVKDNAGNISEKTVDLVLPEFYEENNLIGLYNPAYQSDAVLQYKIGEDGEWTDYSAPFSIPAFEQTTVFARIADSKSVISKTFSSKIECVGAYSESNTDFTFSYKNVSFDFTRSYNSIDKKWSFATDSNVSIVNDRIISAVLPDSTELTFVKTADNTYTNEINGYTLTKSENGYIIQIDDVNNTYDTNGKLISVSNKYDDTITIARATSSITITDGANRTYTLALDSNGNITSATDPANNVITYTYDDNNNLTKVVDQAGVTLGQYSYTNGILTKSMDKTINYNSDGRVASFVYDSGAYLNYTYDDANKTVSTESSTETTTSETYNDAFMTLSSTNEDGNTTEYTYDDHYRTLTETSDGKTVTYTYDGNGNLLSEVSDDEEAENTYYVYDSKGNVVRQQTGNTYSYSVYNDNGELTLTATLKSDYKGDIPELYNADLTCFDTVSYTYDSGMLTKTVDSKEDETVTYLYDSYGNTVKTTSSKVKDDETTVGVTDCTYDIMGNLLTSVSGEDTSSYIYDKAGRTLLANEKGDCTRTIYDNLGRTIQEISPEDYDASKDGLPENNTYADANAGQTYKYAANGTLTSETNRLGKTTKYFYNDIGSKVREEFDIYKFYYLNHGELYQVKVAGVTTVSYSYSTDGKFLLLQETYANDDVIRYTYNDNGDVTAQYHNSNAKPYVTYTYNTDNELTEKVNTDTGLKYVYGTDNKVDVYNSLDNTLVQSYTETETEANEETGVEAKTDITETHFGTSYSSVVKDKSISYTTGSNTIAYNYQTTGSEEDEKVSSDTVRNGETTVLSSNYTYDDNGNVLKKAVTANGSTLDLVNTYDDKDRITSVTTGSKTINYTYDADSQLTGSSGDGYSASYSYDSRGNITNKTVNGTETTFTYANSGWKDQLVSVNGTELTYDANGNVLTYGNKEYTWNTGRNLAQITDGDNTYSYTYDENGIRTSKTVNDATTYYHTKDGVIVSQSDGTNTMYFQYDTNGAPLGFIYNGTQYFYITNHMGDVIGITDSTGTLIAQYEYDEWGNVLSTSDNNIANINPIRYRGYYQDAETGYYYLQSRYYDAAICRFINADVVEISDVVKNISSGINLFSYCNNNPTNDSDPKGNISDKLVKGILGGILGGVIQYLADLINVKCFKGKWSKISTYIISVASGVWDAVTNCGYFKSLLIAVGKNVINQIISKIRHKTNFSALSVFLTVIDFTITYTINKKLKIKSPSKIKDIKKKARELGIKGTKKLTAYLNKQIFKISLANITLSNIKSLVKSTIKNGLKSLFGDKAKLLT